MQTSRERQHRAARLAAVAAIVAMTAIGEAAAQTAGAALGIVVYPDHYVLDGASTGDLDVLERAVVALRPREVRIAACGDDTERLQRAAAHRFRHLGLELRRLAPDSAECRAAIVLRRVSLHRSPSGIDDAAVDRWWHRSMP